MPITLVAFGTATVLEIAAYYIPWMDHLLDTLATPAAMIAGALITASIALPINPSWHWILALIAGGGLAGAVQAGTVAARGLSLVSTGGLANPVVSTGELAGAVVTSVLSLLLPVLTVALVLVALIFAALGLFRKRQRPTGQV